MWWNNQDKFFDVHVHTSTHISMPILVIFFPQIDQKSWSESMMVRIPHSEGLPRKWFDLFLVILLRLQPQVEKIEYFLV